MGLSVGIIGLPNVGKTTLLNALAMTSAEVSNYPFCTKDRNIGVAEVPDERLTKLREVLKPQSTAPATVTFVDIAGLVRGASRGEGLGNKFLAHIREADALAHVVRCFQDPNVSHVDGAVDPVRDVEVVEAELILADLEVAERAIARREKTVRSGDREAKAELELLGRVRDALGRGVPVRSLEVSSEETRVLKGFSFLTAKPMFYIANTGEDEPSGGELLERLREAVKGEVLPISAKVEGEIMELEDPEERKAFLEDLGLEEPGVNRLVRASYRLLGLITFYTTVHDKLRAWPIPRGTSAQEAAGEIHSDMEQGFIRAEVVSWEYLIRTGSWAELHRLGAVRSEGRDYEVQDGEVIVFHFRA
ncbi:MAG TPA: redox-regulated ATPase YchF [Candidatus Latescibacteria bacterium]|nr:redox-regulated ATPase YchF [Candidatus Latescibacterota bacterium]